MYLYTSSFPTLSDFSGHRLDLQIVYVGDFHTPTYTIEASYFARLESLVTHDGHGVSALLPLTRMDSRNNSSGTKL